MSAKVINMNPDFKGKEYILRKTKEQEAINKKIEAANDFIKKNYSNVSGMNVMFLTDVVKMVKEIFKEN